MAFTTAQAIEIDGVDVSLNTDPRMFPVEGGRMLICNGRDETVMCDSDGNVWEIGLTPSVVRPTVVLDAGSGSATGHFRFALSAVNTQRAARSIPSPLAVYNSETFIEVENAKINITWDADDYDDSADQVILLVLWAQDGIWRIAGSADVSDETISFSKTDVEIQGLPFFTDQPGGELDDRFPPPMKVAASWLGYLWVGGGDARTFTSDDLGTVTVTNEKFATPFPRDDVDDTVFGVVQLTPTAIAAGKSFDKTFLRRLITLDDTDGKRVGGTYLVDAVLDSTRLRLASKFILSGEDDALRSAYWAVKLALTSGVYYSTTGVWTGDTSNGSPVISNFQNNEESAIAAGMGASGSGIPVGASVISVDTVNHTVTLDANATADASGVSITYTLSDAYRYKFYLDAPPGDTNGSSSPISCTLTSGSHDVTTADTSLISIGNAVSGTGIPSSTVVLLITSATTFKMSKAATTSGAQSLTFGTGAENLDGSDLSVGDVVSIVNENGDCPSSALSSLEVCTASASNKWMVVETANSRSVSIGTDGRSPIGQSDNVYEVSITDGETTLPADNSLAGQFLFLYYGPAGIYRPIGKRKVLSHSTSTFVIDEPLSYSTYGDPSATNVLTKYTTAKALYSGNLFYPMIDPYSDTLQLTTYGLYSVLPASPALVGTSVRIGFRSTGGAYYSVEVPITAHTTSTFTVAFSVYIAAVSALGVVWKEFVSFNIATGTVYTGVPVLQPSPAYGPDVLNGCGVSVTSFEDGTATGAEKTGTLHVNTGIYACRNDIGGFYPESFPALNHEPLAVLGDGEIYGIVPYGNVCCVFTPTRMAVLTGVPTLGRPEVYVQTTHEVGLVSRDAWAQVTEDIGSAYAGDVIFADGSGIFRYTSGGLVNVFDDLGTQARTLWNQITDASLQSAKAFWDSTNGLFVLGNLQFTGDTYQDSRLIWDVKKNAIYRQNNSPLTAVDVSDDSGGKPTVVTGCDKGFLYIDNLTDIQSRDVMLESARASADTTTAYYTGTPSWSDSSNFTYSAGQSDRIPNSSSISLVGAYVFLTHGTTGDVIVRRISAHSGQVITLASAVTSYASYTTFHIGALQFVFDFGLLQGRDERLKMLRSVQLLLSGPSDGDWAITVSVWPSDYEIKPSLAKASDAPVTATITKTMTSSGLDGTVYVGGLISDAFFARLESLVLNRAPKLSMFRMGVDLVQPSGVQ